MKKIVEIPFVEIDSIPQLIKDFLNQKYDDFKDLHFTEDNLRKKISEKELQFPGETRAILSSVFKRQLSNLNLSEKQHENLKLITDNQTFTITTGHQLNLFTGPVFFIYKILQTIKTAEFLKEKFPNQNFVPLFWMATEDHDFEEINHFRTEFNYYEIKGKSGGAVGRIEIEDNFFIQEFEKNFSDFTYGTELIRWIKEAYQQGKTLTEATRILVNRVFSDYGLVIIDGDDPALKSLMKRTFKEELLNSELLHSTKKTVEFLQNKYGKVQVNPRETNLFYLSEKRERIEWDGSMFKIVDTDLRFTKDEILNELNNNPEKFSPNALMRPVYQETVLPNIMYIGGNAEIMYWLELKNYFEKLNLPLPILVPRNSMLFLDEKTLVKASKLELNISDFFKNFAAVVKSKLLNDHELTSIIEQSEASLKLIFEELKKKSALTDKSFGSLVEAEETRQLKSYNRMMKRLFRAEKIKEKEKLERMENLFLKIHPGKNWQERVFNFSVFYAQFGPDWLQSCYQEMDVEKSEVIVMMF